MKHPNKPIFILFFSCALFMIQCKPSKEQKKDTIQSEPVMVEPVSHIDPVDFEKVIDNDSVHLFTLTNKNGLQLTITNYGQRLVSLMVPDKKGAYDDIVLGYRTLKEYMDKKNFYGATVGRYGNRIGKAKFSIDGNDYALAVNNNQNHLHGGIKGFESVVWKVDEHNDHRIVFSRVSPDMEEGYPGNLSVKVSYDLTDDNELQIRYRAETDKPTVVNLTHHSFFNLKGEGNGNVNDHVVMINADAFTPVDDGLIPTGKIEKVMGTPFDFLQPKTIGRDIAMDDEQLLKGRGYDHNFVLNEGPKNDEGLVFAARVLEPSSGRTMEVYTDEPGVQFYGGNFMDGSELGKTGKPYVNQGAFCFETQHFPDSPNKPNFPSTLLRPGEIYTSTCVYKFGAE